MHVEMFYTEVPTCVSRTLKIKKVSKDWIHLLFYPQFAMRISILDKSEIKCITFNKLYTPIIYKTISEVLSALKIVNKPYGLKASKNDSLIGFQVNGMLIISYVSI